MCIRDRIKSKPAGGDPDAMAPTELFKCLADETRARIAMLVTLEQDLCVCELTAALEEAQPKISRHLALLRSCGLLEDRRNGCLLYTSTRTPCALASCSCR